VPGLHPGHRSNDHAWQSFAGGQSSDRYRRPRGIFLSIDAPGDIEKAFATLELGPGDVDLIVCSDAEEILGIGDLGVGGIQIAAGKLAVYTAPAGIDPRRVIPVSLDVGTATRGCSMIRYTSATGTRVSAAPLMTRSSRNTSKRRRPCSPQTGRPGQRRHRGAVRWVVDPLALTRPGSADTQSTVGR
jgi:hypothetical protein